MHPKCIKISRKFKSEIELAIIDLLMAIIICYLSPFQHASMMPFAALNLFDDQKQKQKIIALSKFNFVLYKLEC